MDTVPLKHPEKNMLAFNGELMVRIDNVTEDGFDFRVLNGAWNGEVCNGKITMYTHLGHRPYPRETEPFVEVLSLTDEERRQWYVY